MLVKVKNWYRDLPENKKWVDMITAVLTIPVLLTIIISNIGNLKKVRSQEELAENTQPALERIIIKENGTAIVSPTNQKASELSPTPMCNSKLPNYEISYPLEGDKIEV